MALSAAVSEVNGSGALSGVLSNGFQALPLLTAGKPTGYQMSAEGLNTTDQLRFAVTCATDAG